MEANERSHLGTGWRFPPTFEQSTGSVALSSAEADIRESLYILFTTIPGERVMWPRYGCDLFSQVFTRIDATTATYMKGLIRDAILHFEPRITVEAIDVNEDDQRDGVLLISLTYTIRATNTRSNMVFPFFIKEGTNLVTL